MKYKIYAYLISVAGKMFPHLETFIVEASNPAEAREIFNANNKDYLIESVVKLED